MAAVGRDAPPHAVRHSRQRPVLAGIGPSALRYAAGAPPVPVAPAITVTSPSSSALSGAAARITTGFARGRDVLTFSREKGITGSWSPTGTLTLTGTAPAAAYRAALRSVDFATSGTGGPARTVSFTVTDPSGTTSAPVARTVDVTASGQPPAVVNQSYSAVGNTPLGVGTTPAAPAATVSGSILTGDTDPDPGATLSVTANTTPANGTVTVNPDGTFTYLPDPGYSGTDSFQVTIAGSTDPAQTATATVTITAGTLVWYVDNSQTAPGNGTAGSPFSTLAAANTAAGANSIVFLYQGDAEYTGGVTMQPGEDLFGQPHGLTAGGYSLVPPAGSPPAVKGIDLAEGADVEGVDVTCPSGNGITASYVNDATVGATTPVSVSGASGAGILVTHGTGTINFGMTSVSGSTGDAVDVNNRSGGTVSFGGPISGTGGGIYLGGNASAASATIAFTGTLTLSTGGGATAFLAAGGGTVTATGPGSTLNSTGTGDALVLDAAIGAAGVTFQSVSSAEGGIDGAGAGPGSLTVTGTGTPGSGGTIQGSGIQLGDAHDPSFTDMIIGNAEGDGITGSGVDGLTLDDSTVSGNAGLDFPADGGNGLTGIVSVTGSAISDASIGDTTGTLSLTVAGTTFGNGSTPGTLAVAADSTAIGSTVISSPDVAVSVTGSTFNAGDGYGAFLFSTLLFQSGPGGIIPVTPGTSSVTFTGNTINDGGAEILAGTGTVCADMAGNTISGPGSAPAGIDLRQNGASTIELPGYTGAPSDTGAVESYLAGGNSISGTPAVIATASGSGGGFTGGSGC
jgi:hypothetical protein